MRFTSRRRLALSRTDNGKQETFFEILGRETFFIVKSKKARSFARSDDVRPKFSHEHIKLSYALIVRHLAAICERWLPRETCCEIQDTRRRITCAQNIIYSPRRSLKRWLIDPMRNDWIYIANRIRLIFLASSFSTFALSPVKFWRLLWI